MAAIFPISALLLVLFSFPVSAQEVPGWERIQGHGMDGHNMGGPEVLSPAACVAKCDAKRGCMGVDYYRTTSQCLLNDADGRSAPTALKPNSPVDFYQRAMADTHGNPAPPYNPGQPDWRVSDAYCHDYAKTAVEQNAYNINHQCGYSGRRWTSDYDGHFRWCKYSPPSDSKFETSQRHDALLACHARGGGPAGGSGGAGGSTDGGMGTGSPGGTGTGGGGVAGSGICVNGFLAIPGAGITGRNKMILRGHTEASCRAACNGQPWCISFELSTGGGCQLAEVNRATPGVQFNTPAGFPWTYYERCGVAGGGTGTGTGGGGNVDQPWTSPAGRTCFQRWVSDTEARLNNNRGSDQYNRDKPFQINIYGLISFKRAHSVFAPDDWDAPDVKRNRFAWLWKHSNYDGQYWYFRHTAPDPRDRVELYGLRWYIRHCMGG